MVADLLAWLQRRNYDLTLSRIAGGLGILDHSDADILLAHLLLSRADDRAFFNRHRTLFSAAALYNDYLVLPEGTVRERSEVRFFHAFMQTIEWNLAHDSGEDLKKAWSVISEAAEQLYVVRGIDADPEMDLETRYRPHADRTGHCQWRG